MSKEMSSMRDKLFSEPIRSLLVKIANAPKGKVSPLITSLLAEIKLLEEKEKNECNK